MDNIDENKDIISKADINNNENNRNKKYNFKRIDFGEEGISEALYLTECKDNIDKKEKIILKDYIMKLSKLIKFILLDISKYNIDLKPLEFDLPYYEILKHYKEKNKFLFELTSEEIELNKKLKSFNFVDHENSE